MEQPVKAVAENLSRLRHSRGVSLSQLAERSGVAKATLSSLEAGRGNPTIETLWAVASALGVPFSQLLSTDGATPYIHIRAGEGTRVHGTVGEAQFLHRVPPNLTSEIFHLRIPATARYESLPHARGVIEQVTLLSGELSVGPEMSLVSLRPGDFLSFAADVPHVYETMKKDATAMVVMSYPGLSYSP